MKKLLLILIGLILFGCGSHPLTEIEKTTDTKVLDYKTSNNYPYANNLHLLYFGSRDENVIRGQIRNIHKCFEEVNVWVYLSEEGYNCYKVNSFDGDCADYKNNILLISRKSDFRKLNYLKWMMDEWDGVREENL